MSSKLREAVSRLVREIEDGMLVEVSSKFECDLAKTLLADVKSALALPRRNCDVGTAEEQEERRKAFCDKYRVEKGGYRHCYKCPLRSKNNCTLSWAQMLYEKEGEE